MNFTLMKKTLSTLCIALAAFSVTANGQEISTVSGKIRCGNRSELLLPPGNFTMRDYGYMRSFTPVNVRKADATAETAKLTLKVTSNRSPDQAIVIGKDFMQAVEFSAKTGSINLPKGTYDLYLEFGGKTSYYVFRENVEVNGDMELSIDQSEANIPIETYYYDENGNELHAVVKDKGEVVEEATCDDIVKLFSFVNKDYGYVSFVMHWGYFPKGWRMNCYVNKLSDRYYFAEAGTYVKGPHNYAYKTIINDFENDNIHKSVPANLKRMETGFSVSPSMKGDKYVNMPGVETAFIVDGATLGDTRMWGLPDPADNGKVVTYIDCPASTPGIRHQMDMGVRPVVTDAYEMKKDYDGYEYEEFSFLVAPLITGNANEELKYNVSCYDLNYLFNVPEGSISYVVYPGHPEFSYTTADGNAPFGESVPVLSYRSVQMLEDNALYPYDQVRYMGRYGEMRETDAIKADFQSEVTENGIFVKVTNDNVEIDGMKGKNYAEVHYDLKKDDTTAPTFQMLQFKDAAGNICDRFDNIQGAKMQMAGGDFSYVDNLNPPYVGHFKHTDPASVKAYYAPHGTDTWTELTVSEDKSKLFLPAFGNFYEADLSSVKADAANAWYDVRLEIADASGNYQKQTIAPAFMLNNTNSIQQVASDGKGALVMSGKTVRLADGKAAKITVCSIDGRTMQSAYTNAIDLSNMGTGMYIVTAQTDNGTVSAKVAL